MNRTSHKILLHLEDLHSNMVKFKLQYREIGTVEECIYIPIWLNSNEQF